MLQLSRPAKDEIREHDAPMRFAHGVGQLLDERRLEVPALKRQTRFNLLQMAKRHNFRQENNRAIEGARKFERERARGTPRRNIDRRGGESQGIGGSGHAGYDFSAQE